LNYVALLRLNIATQLALQKGATLPDKIPPVLEPTDGRTLNLWQFSAGGTK